MFFATVYTTTTYTKLKCLKYPFEAPRIVKAVTSTDKEHIQGFTTALFFSLHSTCEKVKSSSACYLKCKVNHYQSLLMLPEGKLSIASNPTLGIT